MFLAAVEEACERTGWRVHAYVLMDNHYHLLLETPEPNLVVGMQWLQSTYTKRFNARHRLWGHVFQGRYKAIPVEPEGEYFSTVADYIHLNPVRVKGYDFRRKLEAYRWSSYPAYAGTVRRSQWLIRERVLGAFESTDTPRGRRRYREHLCGRVLEIRQCDEPWSADEAWARIRRGWHVGGESFREQLLERLNLALQKGQRGSYGGDAVREHDTAEAERWVRAGMKALRVTEDDLRVLRMNSAAKVALAWMVRRRTAVRNAWIKERLQMGTATSLSARLKKLETSRRREWGYDEYKTIRNIKL
jgi:REP element-mobilizing transposase RayT